MKTYPYRYNKAFAFLNFLYPITVILTLQFKIIINVAKGVYYWAYLVSTITP